MKTATRKARRHIARNSGGIALGIIAFGVAAIAEHFVSTSFRSVLLTVAVFGTVILVSWEDRSKLWFWCTLFAFMVLHIPLMMLVAPLISRVSLLQLPLGVFELVILVLALGFVEDQILERSR